jgi:catechol 2,3-dioxygenase-like lactoylglutathione lyase family enzyme
MTVLSFDHVQLIMPAGGEAAARRFYGEILGLPEPPKPEAMVKRGGAWFEQGPIKIHLGLDPGFAPSAKAHVGLVVSELNALRTALEAAGHTVDDGQPFDGRRRIFVDDPFGNRLELIQGA